MGIFSSEIHTILLSIVIVLTFECHAWIIIADILQKIIKHLIQFGKVCVVHLGTEWNLNNAANLNWQFFKVCVFKFALKGIFAM